MDYQLAFTKLKQDCNQIFGQLQECRAAGAPPPAGAAVCPVDAAQFAELKARVEEQNRRQAELEGRAERLAGQLRACFPPGAAPPAVSNPSFQLVEPSGPVAQADEWLGAPLGWKAIGNVSRGVVMVRNTKQAAANWGLTTFPAGPRVLALVAWPLATGSPGVEQEVANLVQGATYQIAVLATARDATGGVAAALRNLPGSGGGTTAQLVVTCGNDPRPVIAAAVAPNGGKWTWYTGLWRADKDKVMLHVANGAAQTSSALLVATVTLGCGGGV